jgi:hypothetical protein
VLPWEAFASSVSEAQKLAQPEDFDFLHRLGESYATLRRYAPEFLEVLKFRAAPAAEGVLEAIGMLCGMNAENARKIPADAPIDFIKKRWEKLVFTEDGVDRRYYELCAMSELKNALRSGDVWVEGSRQHKDFEEYLVPGEKFTTLKTAGKLPLPVATGCEEYLHKRLFLLEHQLETVNILASANQLPDASITDGGLKITPLDAAVPEAAQEMIDQTAMMLPHVKITELLLEVDAWPGFTGHFTHLKTGEIAKDNTVRIRDERSTPTSPISSHHSTQKRSTSASVMPPTCSMVCSITSPTCGLRSTTRTRVARVSRSCHCCGRADMNRREIFLVDTCHHPYCR